MNYLSEILEQGEALLRLNHNYGNHYEPLEKLEELGKKYNYFIFTGMGSSLFSGYIACDYLCQYNIRCQAVESNELSKKVKTSLDDKTLIIAISQSGESPEVIDLCQKIEHQEQLVVATNNIESELYHFGILQLELFAGEEKTTASKTYTNTIGAMIYIASALAGKLTGYEGEHQP